jgi:GR25 family glycosyltransferase involved in LPS biosynthesis
MKPSSLFFLLVLSLFGLSSCTISERVAETVSCIPQVAEKNNKFLDIHWINLDRSTGRKRFMTKVYDYYGLNSNYRFPALTPNDITIPDALESASECNSLAENETLSEIHRIRNSQDQNEMGRTILLTSHCSPKYDYEPKLLAVTLSHLMAIYHAIHHPSPAKYALIMEDDLKLAFEIDFEKLVQSAPEDFGVLQLVSSHAESVQSNWEQYLYKGISWIKRTEFDNNWCAGAYLINKEKLQPIVTKLLKKVTDKLYLARIVAVNAKHCAHLSCCSNSPKTLPTLPCIFAPRGYEADNFIFNLFWGHSYVSCVPLFTTSSVGTQSTLHQEHVSEYHDSAFGKIDGIVDHLLFKEKRLIPNYVNPTCAEKCRKEGAAACLE